ncbi:MAG: hypothetical protein J5642_03095 [Bacteroidales bacterium]|nr:hypothetical protein [Bacteroidales bacterium]
MKPLLVLILIFCCLCGRLFAQTDSLLFWESQGEMLFESMQDQLMEEMDQVDLSDQCEELLQYEKQKVNLNDVSAEIAQAILKWTDYQYYQLQLYRELYGDLVTVYELAAVDGFSREEVEKMLPYVEVRPAASGKRWSSFFKSSQGSLLLRYRQNIEKQAGYESGKENGYMGSPMRLAVKCSYKSGDRFSMALSGEKDAGEQFFRGAQKQGFDHYAFYVNLKNMGVLKNMVIGDYVLDFGQGLVMGGKAMGVRGGGAGQIRRFPVLLRASAPMSESDNHRGVAVVLGNASYSATLFYSHRFFDGLLSSDETGSPIYEGSLSVSGYHRTERENAQKNVLRNRLYGAHFQMKKRIFEWGVTAQHTQFVAEVLPAEVLYKRYSFSGKSVANISADYKVILHKTILFGEVGMSVNHERVGAAVLQGWICDVDPRCRISALFRYYSRHFVALNGSGFCSGNTNNELGLYLAADFVTGRRTALYLNADLYRSAWLRYQADKPGVGFDGGAKFAINPFKSLTATLCYRLKWKEKNMKINGYYNGTLLTDEHTVRLNLLWQPVSWLELKTAVAGLFHAARHEPLRCGLLLLQDVGVKIEKWGLSFQLRAAFFDTDSYEERLPAYEPDLLYAFTIKNHYGKGMRYVFLANYGIAFLDLQFRFSQTCYDDREEISSGLSAVKGHTQSEVAAQIIFHIR